MSHQLARRTGTVSALVAAASVTMVAGLWPALGTAEAADLRPGRVNQPTTADTTTTEPVQEPVAETVEPAPQDAAPGQVKKDAEPVPTTADATTTEPVQEPVAETVEPAPQDAAPGQVKKDAEPVTAEPVPADATPVDVAPADRAPGQTSDAPGQTKKTPEPVQSTVGPPTGVQPAPAPAAEPAPAEQAPKKSPAVGPPTGLAPAPAKPEQAAAPKQEALVAQEPVAQEQAGPVASRTARRSVPTRRLTPPAAAPVVGPQVPAKAVPAKAAPMGPVVPAATRPRPLSALVGPQAAETATRSGGHQVAAADALPLRPTGAEAIVLPEPVSRPASTPALDFDLTSALPGLAAGTAEAVAQKPELPLGVAAVVVLFLLLQSRIDRRDPKVGLSRVEDDEPLEFEAEPVARLHLRLVTAA